MPRRHPAGLRRAELVNIQGGRLRARAGADDVFTFSIHDERNYPVPKVRSDLDIGLEGVVDDKTYLKVLRKNLPKAIEKARPEIIYLLAGVDVYTHDRLGHMDLTGKGILERDMYVFDEAAKRGIPIVMVLSGGYSKTSWWLHYGSIREILMKYGGRVPRKTKAK